jgi:hypothetical protein
MIYSYKIDGNIELAQLLLKIAYKAGYSRQSLNNIGQFQIVPNFSYYMNINGSRINFGTENYPADNVYNLLDFITKLRNHNG